MDGRTTVWTIIAAVGGLLSGVAAVIALFVTQPATLRMLIPIQVLQQAAAVGPSNQVQTTQPAVSPAPMPASAALPPSPPSQNQVTTSPPTQAAEPPVLLQSQTLGDGVSVSLVSLAEDRSRYIATLRFENAAASPAGVAVLRGDAFRGEMVLTDGLGGSCQMAANGEGWGTMSTAEPTEDRYTFGGDEFRTLQPNGRAQHTIFFNKGRCDTRITAQAGLTISGSFVVAQNDRRRTAAVFFDNLALRRVQ